MSQGQREPTEFGFFLLRAMSEAGFRSTAEFARSAGRSPAVISRWIYGNVDPSARALAEVAPALKIPAADLIAKAYPGGRLLSEPRIIPPQVARLLDTLDKLSPADRAAFLERVDWVSEWGEMWLERQQPRHDAAG